jgi:hypothetical protein
MPRFLIEVSQPTAVARKRTSEALGRAGSHFATHATWREEIDITVGTLTVDMENGHAALAVVPPCMRAFARIRRCDAAGIWSRLRWPGHGLERGLAA